MAEKGEWGRSSRLQKNGALRWLFCSHCGRGLSILPVRSPRRTFIFADLQLRLSHCSTFVLEIELSTFYRTVYMVSPWLRPPLSLPIRHRSKFPLSFSVSWAPSSLQFVFGLGLESVPTSVLMIGLFSCPWYVSLKWSERAGADNTSDLWNGLQCNSDYRQEFIANAQYQSVSNPAWLIACFYGYGKHGADLTPANKQHALMVCGRCRLFEQKRADLLVKVLRSLTNILQMQHQPH